MESNSSSTNGLKLPSPEDKPLHSPSFFEKNLKYSWLLIPLILFLSLYAIYLYSNKKPQPKKTDQLLAPTQILPSSTPAPSPDPSADWKIYDAKDFTFRYPPKDIAGQKSPDEFVLKKASASGKYFDFMNARSGQTPFPTPAIEGEKPGEINQIHKNIISVNGKQIESYIINCNAADCYFRKIYFSVEKNFYEITFNISGGGLLAASDQILSTFKFPDQLQTADTSNWKTVSSLNDALNFKYPPDWILESKNTQDNTVDIKITYTEKNKPYHFAIAAGGYEGPVADKIDNQTTIYKGIQFNKRTWIKDGKVIAISLIPANDTLPFNHIEMTFPPDDNETYLQIFDQILSTFKIYRK